MTIYDLILQRAELIIMNADYTTNPPRSPNLVMVRDRYPLNLSVHEIDAMLWAASEKIADDVIFNNFREI